jgi:iron complex transport system ATP-binding protein
MILSAINLTFAYRDRPVLRDISVSLARGETVALIGPNGSGKSTLLRALLGHVAATGDITWTGRPLQKLARRDLARLVAYLPQTPTFDADQSVRDVLRLGRSPYLGAFGLESFDDATIVDMVATKLGLTDLLPRLIDELSGGQRQRVFVGRCLVQQPAALLLDEPNTFLDLKHQADLVTLVRGLAKGGLGVLIASHDLNLAAAIADRLVLLREGQVVATGTVDEVLSPALLSEAFGTPLRRVDGPRPGILPTFE